MEFPPMANIKPTILTLFLFLCMAAFTIPLAKFAMLKFPVPGLKDLINAI